MPTARPHDVLAGIDLTGTTALVTGGYSGLGLEATRALARAGAHVVVPARRPTTAERALRDIPGTEVHALDLADLESVRVFCDGFLETGRPLGILINGAGVMACPETRVGPEWEAHFAVNHLGHFALAQRLRPALVAGGARVVSVASSGHFLSDIRWDDLHFRTGYDRWLAYAQSKTANALFALHLDRLGTDVGVHAFAVHPGSILTPLQRHIPREEWLTQGWVTPDGEAGRRFQNPGARRGDSRMGGNVTSARRPRRGLLPGLRYRGTGCHRRHAHRRSQTLGHRPRRGIPALGTLQQAHRAERIPMKANRLR